MALGGTFAAGGSLVLQPSFAAAEALDLMQASPVMGFDANIVGTNDYAGNGGDVIASDDKLYSLAAGGTGWSCGGR